ncbi:MAG TPA: zinc-binding dehydrogenase [Thermoleophilaceae bacterium]
MRAAIVRQAGTPPEVAERDAPAPGEGQTLVRVRAATLNPVDLHIAGGRFFTGPPQFPYVPGGEGVGTLAGGNGKRVRFECWYVGYGGDGSLGELALAATESLTELPDEIDDALAAALGTVGTTAWLALERAQLSEGETVLVLGATGAIGQVAVQAARLQSAGRVIAAGRNTERLEHARELGADAVVELRDGMGRHELTAAFREAGSGGVDVVVDPLFGEVAAAALEAGNPGARLVNIGRVAGTESVFTPATLRNKAAIGLSTHYSPVEEKKRVYRVLVDLALKGKLTLEHEVLPLDEIGQAWSMQAGSPGRKLIIDPAAS